MADFTDKAALGTSRVNPSSMVPGATGNAPQGGFGTQVKTPTPQMQALAQQLNAGLKPITQADNALQNPGNPLRVNASGATNIQGPLFPPTSKRADELHANTIPDYTWNHPSREKQSNLPAQTQSMLPGQSESDQKKNRSYKKEDFQLLSDVFKTLSER